MAKIFLVKRTEKDYWGCYYESDQPSVEVKIVDFGESYYDALKKEAEHREKHPPMKSRKILGSNKLETYHVDVEYDIEAIA